MSFLLIRTLVSLSVEWKNMCTNLYDYGYNPKIKYVICIIILCFWTLNVSRTASYKITLVRLSICLSTHRSVSFLKIGSLVFSDIVHDDGWPWYLVTDGARFLKKKLTARIQAQNWAQHLFFCPQRTGRSAFETGY